MAGEFKPGDRVVSIADQLGLVQREHPTRFVWKVPKGTAGVVVEDVEFASIGWLAVVFDGYEKDEDGDELSAPVGREHVELAAA